MRLKAFRTKFRAALSLLYRFNPAGLRFALRVVVAAMATYAVARLLELPFGYWAIITAVIVMQGNIGGSLKAARERFIGTVLGAAFGFLTTLIPVEPGYEWVRLALALAASAYVVSLDARFRVAPATAIITLIVPQPGISAFAAALDRVIEILIGGAIGVIVALSVLPERAHKTLIKHIATLLRQLSSMLAINMNSLHKPRDEAALAALFDASRAELVLSQTLADESTDEHAARLTGGPSPHALVRTARRVRVNLIMITRATCEPWPDAVNVQLDAMFDQLGQAIARHLSAQADALEGSKPVTPASDWEATFQKFEDHMVAFRANKANDALSTELMARIFSLAFAVRQIKSDIADLDDRVNELAIIRGETKNRPLKNES